MSWRNIPELLHALPPWVQVGVGFFMMLVSVGVGAAAKIAEDVRSGGRPAFWSRELFLELPAVGMMTVLGWGVVEYFALSGGAAVAVGAALVWLGPRATMSIIMTTTRVKGGK